MLVAFGMELANVLRGHIVPLVFGAHHHEAQLTASVPSVLVIFIANLCTVLDACHFKQLTLIDRITLAYERLTWVCCAVFPRTHGGESDLFIGAIHSLGKEFCL